MGAPLIDQQKVLKVANYVLTKDVTIAQVCKKFKLSRPTVASIQNGEHKHLPAAMAKKLGKKKIVTGRRPRVMSDKNRASFVGEIADMRKRLVAFERDLKALTKKIHK